MDEHAHSARFGRERITAHSLLDGALDIRDLLMRCTRMIAEFDTYITEERESARE